MRCAILAAIALTVPLSASAIDLKMSMHDGLVTILADNVSVAQILDEWARVGRTTILNADKVTGPLITIELINVPERQALDTLLRSASGYIAAPRAVPMAGASMYDRVTIMPVSHPPAATMAIAPPPPVFQRPPTPNDDDDAPVNMMLQREIMQREREARPAGNPAFAPYPGMQPPAANQGPATSAQPGATSTQPGVIMTSPTPGALPKPPTPNGVSNPYQPGVVRPAGPGGPGGGQ
ncbi:MAG TPA: hypothetical protein VGL62_16175 [Vicinamibacterales bacterium]